MLKNTKCVKKGKVHSFPWALPRLNTQSNFMHDQSVQKYPKSSRLNAADFPVASQLNNAEEQPIILPSRMATQIEPIHSQHCGLGHDDGPIASSSRYTFSDLTDFMYASSHPSIISLPTYSGSKNCLHVCMFYISCD